MGVSSLAAVILLPYCQITLGEGKAVEKDVGTGVQGGAGAVVEAGVVVEADTVL